MNIKVPTINLILCLSEAVDLISPLISNHHKQVACITYYLCEELGMSVDDQKDLTFAAALHDVGILSLSDRLNTLEFDFEDIDHHAEKGYLLLNTYRPFSNIALIVRYHHTLWNNGVCTIESSEEIPFGSYLLNLADRIAILIDPNKAIFSQVKDIRKKISIASGEMFMPEIVHAFLNISKRECFWLDLQMVSMDLFLKDKFQWDSLTVTDEDFLGLISLFSRIIDFKSHYTATHSSGVAATAEAISIIAGFTETEAKMMKIAGCIHDLGKLAVPPEILEKPANLTKDEFDIIRSHAYFTDRLLKNIKEFDVIRSWGALHHERLNGEGYPFHLKASELSMGSRIMAVSDVFVALMEDRPYRSGMNREESMLVTQQKVNDMELDSNIVSLLEDHYDDINSIRINAQNTAISEYQRFIKKICSISSIF